MLELFFFHPSTESVSFLGLIFPMSSEPGEALKFAFNATLLTSLVGSSMGGGL